MPQEMSRENIFGLPYPELKKFMGKFSYNSSWNFVQHHKQDHQVSLLIQSAIDFSIYAGKNNSLQTRA